MNAPLDVMPSSNTAGMGGGFANPNVSAANPGGYASQDEAIADLGLERYNQLYNMGGRVGFDDGKNINMKKIEMLIKRGADNDLIKTFVEGVDDGVINKIRKDVKVKKAKGGMMSIPVRQNASGVKELDYRAGGGFVPVGIKEKADDVPAMLSKNEFVMTADAVRAAGGGSIEKGAQKMYNTMKQLEGKMA